MAGITLSRAYSEKTLASIEAMIDQGLRVQAPPAIGLSQARQCARCGACFRQSFGAVPSRLCRFCRVAATVLTEEKTHD